MSLLGGRSRTNNATTAAIRTMDPANHLDLKNFPCMGVKRVFNRLTNQSAPSTVAGFKSEP